MVSTPLRPWRMADLESLCLHANNRNVSRQLRDRFPSPYLRSDAQAWLSHATSTDPPLAFAITVDDIAVGGIGLEMGVDIHRFSAEVGYWVGESFWGRGLATEAVRAITAYAFQSLGLIRVFAMPFASNPASARVLEKAGYLREGLLVDAAVKHGQACDMALFAVTRDHVR